MIPTGGTSGQIRFVVHSWETLMASVRGFYQYFDQKQINSFCVLPLHHVSGLMQFLRCLTTGGRLVIFPFKDLIAGAGRDINPSEFFISLVPTQLQKLLDTGTTDWLSRFQTVLLGGAAAWDSLLKEARYHRIPLALTYGMTETASQIVTLKPEAFLAGNNSCGQLLPHAKITICNPTGEILGANQTGIITIEADSLAVGYYGAEVRDQDNANLNKSHITENHITEVFTPLTPLIKEGNVGYQLAKCCNPKSPIPNLKSDDLGFFDDQGYLTIVGRRSHKIITGGENVFPGEVEAAILASQLVKDVCVIGLQDNYWGQVVTAVYVPKSPQVSPDLLPEAITDKLCKFKRPKYWIPVEVLPRNGQGKVNYDEIKQVALDCLLHQELL